MIINKRKNSMKKDIAQIISKTKAIIFDMDGVLLDSESICDYAWEKAASEQGLLDISEGLEKCRGTTKIETQKILTELYASEKIGDDIEDIAAGDKGSDKKSGKNKNKNIKLDVPLFMQRTHELFYEIEEKEGIERMYYAKEALEFLSKRYILALASSTREEPVRRQMKNAGLLSYFNCIVTGDMVSHSKPNPEIYDKTCHILGIKPDNCIAVEDSPNGIKSAFDAGVPVVMIPDKIAPSEKTNRMTIATVENLEEFCNLFEDM